MEFGRRPDFGPKPVQVGEEREVTIEAVASKGDGIAKVEGFVIFVPNAKVGDKIKVKITDVKRTCAIAEKIGEAPAGTSEAPAETSETPDETGEAPAV